MARHPASLRLLLHFALIAAAALACVPRATAAPTPPLVTVACLWDSDTLAFETKKFPGLVDVITGRFERQPPRFYQLRLDRVTAATAKDPTNLSLYDDAAVACDRLHRDDEAIDWMARKLAALDAAPDSPETRDHRYRYLANLGTFHAHRWVRAGGLPDHLEDLHKAEQLLAEAITLNPDAHFGREKYQLGAIRWLLAVSTDPDHTDPSILTFMFPNNTADPSHQKLNPQEAVRALSGLIVLGDAWQSVDVYTALSQALEAGDDNPTAYLARLRVDELLAGGKSSFHPDFLLLRDMHRPPHLKLSDAHASVIRQFFGEARTLADEWTTARWQFMELQMTTGQHPDTQPDFWAGWRDEPRAPPTPRYRDVWTVLGWRSTRAWALVALGVAFLLFVRIRRARAAKSITPLPAASAPHAAPK